MMDSVIWAIKHITRDIADTGLASVLILSQSRLPHVIANIGVVTFFLGGGTRMVAFSWNCLPTCPSRLIRRLRLLSFNNTILVSYETFSLSSLTPITKAVRRFISCSDHVQELILGRPLQVSRDNLRFYQECGR